MIDISKYHLILGETKGNHDLRLNYSRRRSNDSPSYIDILNNDIELGRFARIAEIDTTLANDTYPPSVYTDDSYQDIYINDTTKYKLLLDYEDKDTKFAELTKRKCLNCGCSIDSILNIQSQRAHFCTKCASKLANCMDNKSISINSIDTFFQKFAPNLNYRSSIKSMYNILNELGYYETDTSSVQGWARMIVMSTVLSTTRTTDWTDPPTAFFQGSWERLVASYKNGEKRG